MSFGHCQEGFSGCAYAENTLKQNVNFPGGPEQAFPVWAAPCLPQLALFPGQLASCRQGSSLSRAGQLPAASGQTSLELSALNKQAFIVAHKSIS